MQSSLRPVTLIAFALFALQCQFASAQTILYVKADATGANTGTSWADAFTHPQAALSAAAPIAGGGTPVQIWIATGVYKPTALTAPPDGRSATFQLINNVSVYGGFAGTETGVSQRARGPDGTLLNETILSGDLNGDDGPNFTNYDDNVYHVVLGDGTDSTTVLDGVTIRGGAGHGSRTGQPWRRHASAGRQSANRGLPL